MTDIRQIFNIRTTQHSERQQEQKYLASHTSPYMQSERRSLFNQYSSQGNVKRY
jgi:hypothetical protein